MGDDKPYKPPVSSTQFGELQESHSTLESKTWARFDDVDEQMRKLEFMGRLHGKQIEGQAKELSANTQATNRTERKVDEVVERSKDLLEMADYTKKTFTLLEWVVKRVLPVLAGLVAVVANFGTIKGWLLG